MTLSKSQTFLISNKNFTDFLNKYDISFAKKGEWINNIKGQNIKCPEKSGHSKRKKELNFQLFFCGRLYQPVKSR